MKLHLPKALAAAVMALFAIPNALADVTFTETSTLTKGVDYFLPYDKGAIKLTLSRDPSSAFTDISNDITLVTAKAQKVDASQTMAIVTKIVSATSDEDQTSRNEVWLNAKWLDHDARAEANSKGAVSGDEITITFNSGGTKAYNGNTTSSNNIYADADLKFTDVEYGNAYTYTVSNIDQISSASFSDTSVTIINSITGSGDLIPTSGKTALIIENCGNSGVNLNLSGRSLSVAGSVTLGNITSSSSIGSGIFVASGASLSTQSITCAYSPGNMIIHGELNNAGNLILTSGTQNTTNLKGAGTLTVASILTHNGGRLNSSLANVHVTGNVDLGGATITEGQPATDDILTVSGGAFTVDGTTTVRSSRSFNISGGTTTLTGAATVDGTMTVSGGTNTLASLSVSGSMTLSGGTTTLTDAATVGGTMTVSGGTNTLTSLSVSGTMTISNGTTTATSVTVANGGVLKLVTKSDKTSKLRATNGLTVQRGGQLQFTAQDVTGYDGGNTSLKKITIDEGGELWLNHNKNETFAGELNLAGTLRGNGTNEGGETTQWDFFRSSTLNVADNVSTAKVENLTIRLRSGATKFTIGNASTLTIGDITKADGGAENTLTVTGAGRGCGTLAVTGAATLNNLTISGTSGAVSFTGSTLSAAKIHTSGNNASVTIGDDTHNVVATVGRFELGNCSNSGASNLTIASGSKVIVTGNDTPGSDAYKNVGIILGETNNTTSAQIAGNLVAADASIQAGDSGYTAVISGTGLVAVKGLYSSKGIGAVAVTLNGGKLILGENGVQRGTVTLNGGTVGSSFTATDTASMTIAGSVVLSDSSSTVFDTNLYALNTTSGQDNYGTVTRSATDGTAITITGNLSGGGTIEAIGDGILTLAGNIDVGAIEGAGITNITGQINGGDVQNVNILATQDSMGTAATLSGTINFDVQNGTFRHGDETYSTTTGIKKVTRELLLLNNVDATQFTGATFNVVNGAPDSGLTIDTNGIRGTFTSDTTTYLIAGASDEISWSTVQGAGCESVEFSAGGKLTMSSTDIVNSSAIKVQDGVQGSSLSGSGKYVLASGSTDIKVDSLTDWTGTVKLSGSHTGLDLSSTKLGNTRSTILLNDVTGANLAAATVDANVQFTYEGSEASKSDGLTITGSKADITFNGNVTGVLTGNRTAINILNQVLGTELNFTGAENKDVQIIDEKGSSISFSGNATDISTSIVSQRDASTGQTSVSFDNTAAVSMRGEIRNDKWYNKDSPSDVPKGDLSVNLSKNTKVTFSGTVHANTLNVASGAEASFTKDAELDAMIGSGTLKASGGATTTVEDASSFSGTLATSDGVAGNGHLSVSKVNDLAAIKSYAEGTIYLFDSSLTVTVGEMILAGSEVGVYYIPSDGTSLSAESTVITGSLTVSGTSTSTLRANLELKENSMLKLDSALAMGSTLTLGSGITLSGSLLNTWQNDSITLFTGVDSFNGSTEAASVAASSIFSNSALADGAGGYNYTVHYGGGNDAVVELVRTASDTPEPTTATLSLLALMGLAARRRRKAAK